MKDDGGSDENRDRARTGRGVTSSDRPGSPPHGSRHDSDHRARHRPSREPAAHDRHRSRERSGHQVRQDTSASSRHPTDQGDLIPRYRDNKARPELDTRSSQRSRSRGRGGRDSPSSAKRHRSRSHSPSSSHRKRHKKQHSPSRRGREQGSKSDSKKRRRSPHDWRAALRRRRPSRKSPNQSEDTHQSRQRSLSRSPPGSEIGAEHASRDSRHQRSEVPRHTSRSRSPQSKDRRLSSSHQGFPSRAGPPTGPAASHSKDFDRRPSQLGQGPTSPKSHRERKREDFAEPPTRSDIDDDMTSRSSHRGGYNPTYSHQSHHGHDHREYSKSPQHQDSYHNSPQYGSGRSGWGGHQYSSQQQYSQHHHGSGNYNSANGPPTGPQSHYHNSSHSPPYAAPSGPQGGYRSNRGGGFRGGAFSNRGGYRGSNFKTASRNSNQAPRGNHFSHEEDTNRRPSTSSAQHEATEDIENKDVDSNYFDHPDDAQTDDPNPEKPDDDTPNPTTKPPYEAFWPSSKPAPTAPKPEISQKFNAAPQRRLPIQNDNRDREPPPSAPTEPSSARSRRELRQSADGPKMTPRTRKVTKIMRRPKPRPTLPADLIDSESVFFRKPGNESVVGSGTYGKVFKGRNVYTEGLVALKRIRMEGERDGFPVTAVREIKLLQSLRHPNIVNLQEVMVEKNDCFMVFEYLSHDLTGLLNHPSFSLDGSQKKHMAKQLFDGLNYLHERSVLHRDIKAANILVGSNGVLKLADFGLARFYAKRHQLDYTNRVITIWYRSPELLLGETKYTAAVDVWSAACVMVEIFTRHAIFAGDGTELSQLEKIYNVLGTPNLQDWPGLVDMAWFELLRPTVKRKNVFAEKYEDRVSPAAFELLASMFSYDPAKRPTAAMVLQHPYFTTEEPLPRQAIELADIGGDWHEFESKALRKENERKDREARRAAKDGTREKDKKRVPETHDRDRNAKRLHVDQKSAETGVGDGGDIVSQE
ncbi:CTD kinase subunit alpha [Cladobotryum mycophilum]|uniref:cyclin-dependent kinase n=1 Tax=Cladobotryum mycophilum TaxID=491253 RepID=A0ABR0SNQ3_9HYPO